MDRLIANNKFTLGNLPPGRKTIFGRLLNQRKVNEHNEIGLAKSRLVIRGFMQEERVDYIDTLSASAICLLTRISVRNGLQLSQPGIQQASVQGPLNGKANMDLTPGCGGLPGNSVMSKKPLYDLRQGSHELQKLLITKFLDYVFEPSSLILASSQ